MSRVLAGLAATAVVTASALFSATPAAAHERRTAGPYQLVVGWLSEPAFAGSLNAVDLRVTDSRVTPARPVEGLEKTLAVDVFQGGLTTPLSLTLRARFGQPGAYAADFVPTREGSYTFQFKGKIEALDLFERFDSGPGRFDDVGSSAPLQYPERVPAGSDLSRRLADIQSTAEQVRLIALAALALGAVALAAAILRRRA